MNLKENVSTIDSKPQEFKSDGQGHKISIFKNEEKLALFSCFESILVSIAEGDK